MYLCSSLEIIHSVYSDIRLPMSHKRQIEPETLKNNSNKKQKIEAGTSKRLCNYCGDDLSDTTEDQCHPNCRKEKDTCKNIAQDFMRSYAPTKHVLYIGLHVHYIYDLPKHIADSVKELTKHKKNVKIEELRRKVSALRNSGGGYLLMQLVGLSPEDRYTGALDRFMAVPLNSLIEDGKLFCNVYTKTHIQEFDKFRGKNCSNIIMLHAAASSSITTLEFNSKIALDDQIQTPTPHTMISWVRELKNDDVRKFAGNATGILNMTEFPEGLQESRNIQFKSFDLDKFPSLTMEEKIKYILELTRLPEYVSAFAKNEKGGHFLLGIREEDKTFKGYDYVSKCAHAHGISCGNTFTETLKIKLLDRLLVYNINGQKEDRNIFEVRMNNTLKNVCPSDKCLGPVLQVSVKPIAGVVFSNKDGPVAYRVEGNTERPCTVEEWFGAIN